MLSKKTFNYFGFAMAFCALMLSVTEARSAQTSAEADTLKQTSADTLRKARTLSLGLSYGNNSSFLGRYQSKTLPYLSADVSYVTKTGFWISVIAYDIHGTPSRTDEFDLLGGWSGDLSKRVDASFYYTKFFFAENTELLKAYVSHSFSASLGLDWKILYTKATSSLIIGDSPDFFLIIDNSRYLEISRIFSKNDYISFEPRVSFIGGTQTFVESFYINQGVPGGPPGSKPGMGGPPGSGSPDGSTSGTTVSYYEKRFQMLSYEFSMPITYGFGNFAFEVSGRYSTPMNLPEGYTLKPQFFATTSIIYSLRGKK
jgi:hypothetical protein